MNRLFLFFFLLFVACGPPPVKTVDNIAVANEKGPGVAPPPVVEEGNDEDAQIPILPGDPRRGPANAPVTIVVFGDFECPHCADADAANRLQPSAAAIVTLTKRLSPMRRPWHHLTVSRRPYSSAMAANPRHT